MVEKGIPWWVWVLVAVAFVIVTVLVILMVRYVIARGDHARFSTKVVLC